MQSNIANTKDKTNNNLTIIVSSLAEVVIIIAVAILGICNKLLYSSYSKL